MNENSFEMAWQLLKYKIYWRAKGYRESMKNERSEETDAKLSELIEVLNEMMSIEKETTTNANESENVE